MYVRKSILAISYYRVLFKLNTNTMKYFMFHRKSSITALSRGFTISSTSDYFFLPQHTLATLQEDVRLKGD